MGKIAEDFERFLYANYPDDYRRATADGVTDDVITAILSRQSARYDIWKRIPEWIRAEYRDDIPEEVLNGNVRVEAFVQDEYEKLGYEDTNSENIVNSRSVSDAEFVANITVAFLAAGYTAETVARLAANHGKREDLLKQMAIHGRTPELAAAWIATRESDIKAISQEYDGNEKLIHKKALHLVKKLSRMKRSKDGYDEEEYKQVEEKLKEVMAFVMTNPEARDNIFEHLKDPAIQKAIYLLVPEVRDSFLASMKDAGISITPKEGNPKAFDIALGPIVKENIKSGIYIPEADADWRERRLGFKNFVTQLYDENEDFVHKKTLHLVKQLSRMKRSNNGYSEEEYNKIEKKLKDTITGLQDNSEAKMKVFEHLKDPAIQKAMYLLDPEVRNSFFASMKDVGISIRPNDGRAKSFEISRDTLVEGLKKDFNQRIKIENILANKHAHNSTEFVRAKAKDVVGMQPNDKIDKLVMMNKGDSVSRT